MRKKKEARKKGATNNNNQQKDTRDTSTSTSTNSTRPTTSHTITQADQPYMNPLLSPHTSRLIHNAHADVSLLDGPCELDVSSTVDLPPRPFTPSSSSSFPLHLQLVDARSSLCRTPLNSTRPRVISFLYPKGQVKGQTPSNIAIGSQL